MNRPIYELCTGAEQILWLSIFMCWWYQEINPEEDGYGAIKGTKRELGLHGEIVA